MYIIQTSDRQTYKQADRQTYKRADRRNIEIQTDIQTDIETETDGQIDIHTVSQTSIQPTDRRIYISSGIRVVFLVLCMMCFSIILRLPHF